MAYKDPERRRTTEKAWRHANPDKVKAIQKRYRDAHLEQGSPRSMKWNREHRGLVNKRAQACNFKRLFGISLEEKAKLLANQGGRCAICGAGELDKMGPWCLDHDHITGKVRGVLCRRCNMTLGSLGDNPAILRNMIAYLIREL